MIVCTPDSAYNKKKCDLTVCEEISLYVSFYSRMVDHVKYMQKYLYLYVVILTKFQLNKTSKREIQRSKTVGEWLPRSKRNTE